MSAVMRIGRTAAALVTALLATCCTHVVDGTVRPTPAMTPRPVTGRTVKQVLLDDAELSKMLSQSFKSDPGSPARFGGRDRLFDMDAVPRECAGVVFELQKSAYGPADIKDVARETWWNASAPM